MDYLIIIAMLLGVCFVFFMAYLIDLNSVIDDEQEMEKREKTRRENPENVYFILVALVITVLNILLIQLAPDKPIPGSVLEGFYEFMGGLTLFFYFSAVYFFGKKLVLAQPLKSRFLVSVILVNFCLWPLMLFSKIS